MNLCSDDWNPLMEYEEEGAIALRILALAMEDGALLPDNSRGAIEHGGSAMTVASSIADVK